MHITQLPDTIDSLAFESGPPRSPGLHFSDIRESILKDITPKKRAKRFTRSESPEATNEQRGEGESDARGPLFHNYIQGGFTFEHALERSLVERRAGIFRPGEIVKDGIAMSPDGICIDDWTLEEFKFTWKSSNGAPEDPKFWGWIIQMKAYCHALEINRARLRAFFVNGDYKAKTPEYKVWQFVFTDEELHENWQMIVQHAKQKGWL
jgi:hypothetical protein